MADPHNVLAGSTVDSTAVAVQHATPPAVVPDDLRQSAGLGTEKIGTDDVRPAQLKLCQAGTPQRKTDDPKQIAGLNELDFFNELSGSNYGRSVQIVVINMLGHRNVEFKPGELGTVLDRDVPDNDPRAQWPVDEHGHSLLDDKGNKLKPAATKYFNYLVWVPSTAEIVVLSISSTQIPVAIKLNGMLKLPLKINGAIIGQPPSWARTFELSSFMDKDGEFSWGAMNLKIVGVTDQSTRELCASLYESYAKKKIDIDYSADADADTFDVDKIEREAAKDQRGEPPNTGM